MQKRFQQLTGHVSEQNTSRTRCRNTSCRRPLVGLCSRKQTRGVESEKVTSSLWEPQAPDLCPQTKHTALISSEGQALGGTRRLRRCPLPSQRQVRVRVSQWTRRVDLGKGTSCRGEAAEETRGTVASVFSLSPRRPPPQPCEVKGLPSALVLPRIPATGRPTIVMDVVES